MIQRFVFCSALAFFAMPTAALSLGAAELLASKQLGCVLAEDALGHLSERQFNERFDSVVEGFDSAQTDVVYAQALGYIDGLLFGLSGSATVEAESRLRAYANSDYCTAGASPVASTVTI
ncbi:MAG: hypothetical protein AAF662_05135 [Pseudomonadota bacterium]